MTTTAMTPAADRARADSSSPTADPANDNRGSENPTIIDLPREISDERRRRFAEVLARILVARALMDLGIQAPVDEDCPASSEHPAEEGEAKR